MISAPKSIDGGLAATLSLGQEAIDSAGLDLRALDSGTRAQKINRIAVQFEQVFIQTLLKTASMEEEQSSGEDGGLGIRLDGTRDLRTLMLSQHVADNGGFGLADVIRRQIEESYAGQTKPTAPGALQVPKTGLTLSPNQAVRPVGSATVSSAYGWRQDPIAGGVHFHRGVDFAVAQRTPVHSMDQGQVMFAGWRPGLGNTVEIKHPSGLVTKYGHNSELKVRAGDRVEPGAVIALSGSSGRSTGPHLHFEVWRGSVPQNPLEALAAGKAHVFAGNADLTGDKA